MKKTAFKVVIPARFGSTRLPGKPLLDIAGKPMIAHVCARALEAQAEQVVVATDDRRIYSAVETLGLQVVMTDPNHASGSERIAEVASVLKWRDEDIIVNLQGDEPLIPPDYINEVADALAGQELAGMATLAARIDDQAEIFNPNAVKVVLDKDGYALYFSRAPIPWERGAFPERADLSNEAQPFLRHIGMYAYTVEFLTRYCDWPASPLEAVESLEQLRVLWHGGKIRVNTVAQTPPAGVDTEQDLHRVERLMTETHFHAYP
ncbi:3-deoxy-manno-octulosonate cytidylyltransferase [Methylomarinum sp. Ch1-1]|uniref:3-deoxy-manno-octulosonate cytidylyltransferase n=1 Tax=Methylomarinum roseum TaxID=3067653 RepID=A0AAU7NRM8_9GAMM|nr:3-deoxy-manno-octulosonate cytidylyltransferase [Methylomarinum sp. Ch1-1]MDP4520726.1 3-deoxy-manno-octulosonate cytidylyltransferase [Methylomarinum sp. Ch1-1]